MQPKVNFKQLDSLLTQFYDILPYAIFSCSEVQAIAENAEYLRDVVYTKLRNDILQFTMFLSAWCLRVFLDRRLFLACLREIRT